MLFCWAPGISFRYLFSPSRPRLPHDPHGLQYIVSLVPRIRVHHCPLYRGGDPKTPSGVVERGQLDEEQEWLKGIPSGVVEL